MVAESGKYILAIDQGTTGTTVIIFDRNSHIVGRAYNEFTQYYPKPGWVEHDPEEIWNSTVKTIEEALSNGGVESEDISAIGITNQRETTLLWDTDSGRSVYNAIVWQCRRTSDICEELKKDGLEDTIRDKTGLVVDAYFSGPKIKWIMDNVDGVREKARYGKIRFGNIDTWLIWKLTGGDVHITDYTNASRTMIFNIKKLRWDDELLKYMDIPKSMLPSVEPSSQVYGYTVPIGPLKGGVPIAGIAGDQQASLFGQGCFSPGMAKCTYGTGSFILMNTGREPIFSQKGLLTTIAWGVEGEVQYALEGSNFVSGAGVQWLRDGLKVIQKASDSQKLAESVEDTGGVYLVPAFVGLGAPYWDMYARGVLIGITRGTGVEQIVRATLEAIAYQVRDVLDVMSAETGISLKELRVDGGASSNDFLMQFQSDILDVDVLRPTIVETTALGASYLAGLAVGYWSSKEEIAQKWEVDAQFSPKMEGSRRKHLYDGWKRAVQRSLGWSKNRLG